MGSLENIQGQTARYAGTVIDLGMDSAKPLTNHLSFREGHFGRMGYSRGGYTLDNWLQKRKVNNIADFRHLLLADELDISELSQFCKNTILLSSLPYLNVILDSVEDGSLRMEANLARQCIKHIYKVGLETIL